MDPTDPIRRVSAASTDPGYFPGGMTGVLYGRLARFAIGQAEWDTLSSPLPEMRGLNGSLVILPAHDPAAASRLAQATGQVPTLTTA